MEEFGNFSIQWGSTVFAVLVLAVVALLSVRSFSSSSKAEDRSGLIPKGSFGWPFIGESLELFSVNPVQFTQDRVARFGKVFKTRIMGMQTVIVTDPDMAKYIYLDRQHQFTGIVPGNSGLLLGEGNMSNLQGARHDNVYRLVQSCLLPDALKHKIADIEDIACELLNSYVGKTVLMANEAKMFTLQVGILFIMGLQPNDPISEDFRKLYVEFEKGISSLPINFPGTQLHKSLTAKKKIHGIIKNFLQTKMEVIKSLESEKSPIDLLLKYRDQNGEGISPSILCDHICSLLFAAHDTTATALTWVLKYLQDDPKVLQAVTMEQDEIRRRKGLGEPLTWSDIKSMTYTSMVVQESLRVTHVAVGTPRIAAQDVEYNGYMIPKGWLVVNLLAHIHSNAEYYSEPLRFDPDRFKKTPLLNTFMPFGAGNRYCVGSELAKSEILVFVHHLTASSWARVGKDIGKQYWPFPVPRDRLPICVGFNKASTKLQQSC